MSMALPSVEAVAFSRPGGESCGHSRNRPVDLNHLSRQTMGDRALEQEVLSMFLQQAKHVREKICAAPEAERLSLAHGLKGAARGIGAFRVADIAGEVESDPTSVKHLRRLATAIEDVRDFVAAINR